MKTLNIFKNIAKVVAALMTVFIFLVFVWVPVVRAATNTVNLLSTDGFAVLGPSSLVDAPSSVITGNVGSNVGSSIKFLQCSEVSGTLYDADGTYSGNGGPTACLTTDNAKLTQAETDLKIAWNDANGRVPTSTFSESDNQLGGKTLTPGVYRFGNAPNTNLIGTLTLDGQKDPNAVFIFQATSDFATAANSSIVLTNGAQACNVFWVVQGQAIVSPYTTFVGNILAGSSANIKTYATVNGRILASDGVILDHNTISRPSCSAVVPGFPNTGLVPGTLSTNVLIALGIGVVLVLILIFLVAKSKRQNVQGL